MARNLWDREEYQAIPENPGETPRYEEEEEAEEEEEEEEECELG